MVITHCICTGRSFAQLTELAKTEGLNLEQLAERTAATRNCGLCRPYLRAALTTGQTVFHEVITEQARPPR